METPKIKVYNPHCIKKNLKEFVKNG